jgi:hypothetical protein
MTTGEITMVSLDSAIERLIRHNQGCDQVASYVTMDLCRHFYLIGRSRRLDELMKRAHRQDAKTAEVEDAIALDVRLYANKPDNGAGRMKFDVLSCEWCSRYLAPRGS